MTLRKTAEIALKSNEDFLQRIGRVAGIGGWELNLTTDQLQWSPQVRSLFGVGDDYAPTVDAALAFFPVEARSQLRRALEDARTAGTPWDLELPFVQASGEWIFVRTIGEVELDATGCPYRVLGTLQNTTHRKQLELKLAANERFIRGIADNVPVRIAYLDDNGFFRFVNRTLFERMQTSWDGMIGRHIGEFAPQPFRLALESLFAQARQGRPQRFGYEDMVQGDARQIEIQIIPDLADGGTLRGMYVIGVDITHLKRSEAALRELTDIFDNTPDFIAQTDWRGNLRYINGSARKALGLDEHSSLEGRTFKEFYPPETVEQYLREIIPTVKREGAWIGESQVLLEGGRQVPVDHMVIAHRDASGRVARYSSLMRDISAEVAARKQLDSQTAILNTVVEASPVLMAVFDRDMRFVLVNEGYERWRGVARSELIGRTVQETSEPTDFEFSRPWAQRALEGERVSYEKEYLAATGTRHLSLTYVPLKLADGAIVGYFAVGLDVTSQHEEKRRLTALAQRDPLTGLLNRSGLEQFMESAVFDGDATTLAAIYIDLDHFKPVNDTHGHAVGDLLLQEFANRLRQQVRPQDAVARLGGDEFVVVLTGIRENSDAAKVAEKIVHMSRKAFFSGSTTLQVGVSVGVACDASEGWRKLIESADAMAYRAKIAGRGRFKIANER